MIGSNGVYKRFMGLSEGAEKILAIAAHPYFAADRVPDHLRRRIGCRTLYLYFILKRMGKSRIDALRTQ
jgi:hypothetical protein